MTTAEISIIVAVIISTASVAWAIWIQSQYDKVAAGLAKDYTAKVDRIFNTYDELKKNLTDQYAEEFDRMKKELLRQEKETT